MIHTLKRILESKKRDAENRRDCWLEARTKCKDVTLRAQYTVCADIHQEYARIFRDMIKGG